MEYNETEAEQFFGDNQSEQTENELSSDELTEEQLMDVWGGPNREALLEKAFQTKGIFRESHIEKEKEAMFRELESQGDEKSSNTSFRR